MVEDYRLENFIDDLERITGSETSPAAVVGAARPLLARLLQNPDCLAPEYRKRGEKNYGRYMLHRAPRFNVTAVVWGPGDMAKAHNHETWGLVGVVENQIQETRFCRRDDGKNPDFADLEITTGLTNSAGMVSCLVPPDDDIHQMNNITTRNTVEIHVYGKDLANMPRLQFDPETKSARRFASPKYDNC